MPMPRFKVYRYKRYEAFVDALNLRTAAELAHDLPGKAWRLVEDMVDGDVAGFDNARRHVGVKKPFRGEA